MHKNRKEMQAGRAGDQAARTKANGKFYVGKKSRSNGKERDTDPSTRKLPAQLLELLCLLSWPYFCSRS